jgi:hypothetical protein
MTTLLALMGSFIGVLPTLIAGKVQRAIIGGVISFIALWFLTYTGLPSLVVPIWGSLGWQVIVVLVIMAVIHVMVESDMPRRRSVDSSKSKIPVVGALAGLILQFVIGISGCEMIRSSEYAELIGKVEAREWTQDIQPKDPRHVRLVPQELAGYLATKQLGEAKGAIGSQFKVAHDYMTLQVINDELWYVVPLDFNDFSVWQSVGSVPGYVMIHGEDPLKQVVVKTGHDMKYTPGAFFGKNLERHLWEKYRFRFTFEGTSFEIDEDGKPFWVVCVCYPMIGRDGPVVKGVVVVDPENGNDTFYTVANVPSWIDRVYPAQIIEKYATWNGKYHSGWWNSFWAKLNLTEPGSVTLVYGSEGSAQWVTDITSNSSNDASLIGLLYTNARTGKSVRYHAVGGTELAAIELVNNKVSYRKLHGSSSVLYNIYGVMTSIIPLLGESHTFQGVAMVDIANMQVVDGATIDEAARAYQKMIMLPTGQRLAPEKEHDTRSIGGAVERIVAEVEAQSTVYYIYLSGVQKLFSGTPNISPVLRMTQPGDKVTIRYIDSDESVIPILRFENAGLSVTPSKSQRDLEKAVQTRLTLRENESAAKSNRDTLKNMSDAEIEQLLKGRQK